PEERLSHARKSDRDRDEDEFARAPKIGPLYKCDRPLIAFLLELDGDGGKARWRKSDGELQRLPDRTRCERGKTEVAMRRNLHLKPHREAKGWIACKLDRALN